MKKLIIFMIFGLLFLSSISVIADMKLDNKLDKKLDNKLDKKSIDGFNPIIKNKDIFVENEKYFINANPHTLEKSGYVNIDINPKIYGNNVDVLFGFTNENCKPVSCKMLVKSKWKEIKKDILKYDYSYFEYHNWYVLPNLKLKMNTINKLKTMMYAKKGTSGEYMIAIKPNSKSFSKSISDNEFLCLHPFWNVTYSDVEAHYHLNSSSGTVAIDSSPNNNNGTLTNMEDSDWVSGKLNNCLDFDGTYDYVNLSQIANFERDEDFSVECWVNTTTSLGYLLTKNSETGMKSGWNLYIDGGFPRFYLGHSVSANNYIKVRSTETVNDGNFHHIVATYDGSSDATGVSIYVDGVDRTGSISQNSLTDSILTIANCQISGRDGYNCCYGGLMDEVVIYNKELNQSEVDYRYNDGNGTENIGFYYTSNNISLSNPNPSNNSINVDYTLTEISVDIGYNNGNFNYTIETSGNLGNKSESNVTDGIKTLNIHPVESFTKYYWWVNVSAYGNESINTSMMFTFTTERLTKSEIEISIEQSQWIVILTFILFGFLFYVGYNADKKSGGLFMIIAGFTLFYLQTILPLSPIYVIPLLSPLAVYIIYLGIAKLLFVDFGEGGINSG